MLDTLVSGFNSLVEALQSLHLTLNNMMFALIELPQMSSSSITFTLKLLSCFPSYIIAYFIFGSALAVVAWLLPGKIGG